MMCDDSHHVSLALTARAIDAEYEGEVEDGDDKIAHDAHFTVAVSFEAAADGPAAARKRFWDEMSIKAIRAPSAAPSPSPCPPPCATTKQPRRAKTVSWLIPRALSSLGPPKPRLPAVVVALASITRNATDIAFIETRTAAGPDGTIHPLDDLCTTLRRARDARPTCYGYLVDSTPGGVGRHFRVSPHGTAAAADSHEWSIVTLRDVLEQKPPLRPLTFLKDKILLGLAVASSVLQLSKTPWLPEEVLGSGDVHFFKRGQGQLPCYRHPFLLRTFPAEHLSPPAAGGSNSNGVDRHTTLFALGILLLEIILGSTLDRLREPCEAAMSYDGDETGVFRDSVTAFRLLEQRVALINPLYKAVVERCIECSADQDLETENFREQVCSGVVMELEAILGHTELAA
jgi:hypothetical protein